MLEFVYRWAFIGFSVFIFVHVVVFIARLNGGYFG